MGKRIGIDVRKAADFGIGRYIEQLVQGLAGQVAEDESFVLFGGTRALEICRAAAGDHPRFTLVEESSRSYSLAEHLTLPRALRRADIDLYHSTHYVLPHGPLPRRVVTSVHDLIHLIFPGYLPSKAALLYARHFFRRAVRRSDAVITGSEASRSDLLQHFPDSHGEKISVIPYGVDSRFRPVASPREAGTDREELQQLGIDGPYLLFVGNFKPHKNLEQVLRAYARFQARDSGAGRSLVLVGRDLSSLQGLGQMAEALPRPELLKAVGHQPDRLLPVLYRNADLFLFPSLYEGFGLPPLEALACGTPVLAARCGALGEVLGDAAHFCDPRDPDHIARAMLRLTADPETAAMAARLGPARSARYRWADTAARTLALYRSLLSAPFVERRRAKHIE